MDNENKEKFDLEEIKKNEKVKEYIIETYGNKNYLPTLVYRWSIGRSLPSMEVLYNIAKIMHTNIAYMLGLTYVSMPFDEKREINPRSLDSLLKTQNMSKTEFSKLTGFSYQTVINIANYGFPVLRRNSTIITSADILNVSVDYLLGLCDYRSWEEAESKQKQRKMPFARIKPGNAAIIVSGVSSDTEAKTKIAKGECNYVLVSNDGSNVISSSGKMCPIDDEMFLGTFVFPVIPEP